MSVSLGVIIHWMKSRACLVTVIYRSMKSVLFFIGYKYFFYRSACKPAVRCSILCYSHKVFVVNRAESWTTQSAWRQTRSSRETGKEERKKNIKKSRGKRDKNKRLQESCRGCDLPWGKYSMRRGLINGVCSHWNRLRVITHLKTAVAILKMACDHSSALA